MRADLPPHVAAAIERCERASLVFDLARIDDNLRAFADAARASGATVLFAAKSFPHPRVRELAARWFDGFDAASAGELAELPPARVVSIVDPSGRAGAEAVRAARVIVGCETVEQVAAAPAHAEIAIRISASLTGRDPAVGAVQDGSGHRRSRFGVDVDPARQRAAIAELARAAGGRRVGLHVHHGPVAAASGERFVATARAVMAAAEAAAVVPAFVDVGGAWHAVGDIARALAEVRAALPASVELIVEPGRVIADGAGFACGHVVAVRELDDRPLRVVDLSRICHLRWSHVELVGQAPHAGTGRTTLFAGPTCFEEDVLGEWTVDTARFGRDARVIVRNVSGYALAWNTSFGGVPAADVVLV